MQKNIKKKNALTSTTFFKGMRVLNFDFFHPRKGFLELEKTDSEEENDQTRTLSNEYGSIGDYEILWI